MALLAAVAGTLILQRLPYGGLIGWPLVLIGTLAHEGGHALTALALGGDVHGLSIYADGSGVASWSGSLGRVGRAAVAAGGLVGPAVVAAGLFAAARTLRGARATLGLIGLGLLLFELLIVRNAFGLVFVGAVALSALALAARARGEVVRGAVVFVALQLSLSVFSRSDYLFTDTAHTGAGVMPSDVAQMAAALWLPYPVWGALCGAVSIGVLLLGVRRFLDA